MAVAKHISELIGNTPLLEIPKEVHGLKNIRMYAKLEMQNIVGSLKDRIAWNILKDDIQEIGKKRQQIVELSSGNTAKALTIFAGMYGASFKTVTNRIKVPEQKDILMLLGAEIEELPGLSECPDLTNPNDPLTYIVKQINAQPERYYHTDQYFNSKNQEAHYKGTGQEILDDLGKAPDYFVVGLGTAGSSSGVTRRLREENPNMVTVGIVADKADFIPGIRTIDEMYEVGLFDPDNYKNIEVVNSQEAVDGSLELIRKVGLLAGPTSGSTYQGALKYLQNIDKELTEEKSVVFIACDRVETYISYFKKRRPELFHVKENEVFTITHGEVEDHYESISIDQIDRYIEENNPLIIDMRGTLAFQLGSIHKKAINIPLSSFEEMLAQGLPFAKNQAVLLVCPVGSRTKKYSAIINMRGGKAVSLEGGISSWVHSGRKLIDLS
ncbi:pyridoxal-phosphate dependent enzyme [Candidatus Nomurabacteria bacterium]|nr:pyridoxal-phosphate dependent enzyme [Candidatus Nomurabacteria bacterium]